jgi:gas vesicle protein
VLLTSDKARSTRQDVEDNVMKWAKRLKKLGNTSIQTASDLKLLLAKEISGLSDETRKRILALLNGAQETASKLSNDINRRFA